jgi:hypothetical protein
MAPASINPTNTKLQVSRPGKMFIACRIYFPIRSGGPVKFTCVTGPVTWVPAALEGPHCHSVGRNLHEEENRYWAGILHTNSVGQCRGPDLVWIRNSCPGLLWLHKHVFQSAETYSIRRWPDSILNTGKASPCYSAGPDVFWCYSVNSCLNSSKANISLLDSFICAYWFPVQSDKNYLKKRENGLF